MTAQGFNAFGRKFSYTLNTNISKTFAENSNTAEPKENFAICFTR